MKKMDQIFYRSDFFIVKMLFKLCVIVFFIELGVSLDLKNRVKRREYWSWGFDPKPHFNRIIGATTSKARRSVLDAHVPRTTEFWSPSTTTLRSNDIEDGPCEPYSPQKPDFNASGRRISQVKCYEYIWQMKVKLEQESRDKACSNHIRANRHPVVGITGGIDTKEHEFIHMAAIGWKTPNQTWNFKCGGTLISAKFVLTAAHCAKTSPLDTSVSNPEPEIVKLGVKNILSEHDRGAIEVKIRNIIINQIYNAPKKYNDIALLELDHEVEFSQRVQPACLWTLYDTSEIGSEAEISGWGITETDRKDPSKELKAATVDIIEPKLCNQLLKPFCNRNWCGLENQICAGKLAGGVDSCQGDSGGPLQVKIKLPVNERPMYYVLGVTSFGIGCGRARAPGVYTRVSSYIDWLESIVWP